MVAMKPSERIKQIAARLRNDVYDDNPDNWDGTKDEDFYILATMQFLDEQHEKDSQ